ncbi:MAG: glycosyltransferase family 2 protein [Propionibacteriaceae bacterium]|jgi:GT2 family glycosyltransferase|nr:glycosyltransferase family 2 protein [Propionibacteriaceae bacterium]
MDQPPEPPIDLATERVTAVLVSRNGEAWLPGALTGLATSTLRPTEVIAVDNRSDDDSFELLLEAQRVGVVDQVLSGSGSASFGEAVNQALSFSQIHGGWIWLLHDDAVPDPDALAQLLTLGVRTPGLGVALPLLVRPSRRRHTPLVLELGVSIAGTGRRHLPIEPGEAAQGQYDPSPVLGGSTCGMLVRRDVFETLRGFSSSIPSYRDGVEFGWRANLAGYGVMTCPEARFAHHQVGNAERRNGTLAQAMGRSEPAWDRLMGMRLVAAHSPGGLGFALASCRLVLAALLRALGFLLDKAPDLARDELHAVHDFIRSGEAVGRLRRRIARLRPTAADRERADALRPPWWSALSLFVHTAGDLVRDLVGGRPQQDLLLDDLLGDEFESRAAERKTTIPHWAGAVVVAVLAIVSGRHLLFVGGPLRAAQLLPAPATLSDAFHLAVTSPAGTMVEPAPWLLLEAIGSIPFFRPNWFVLVVLLAAVPVTMLTAGWYLRRHLGQHKKMSWILALAYALLPALLGGLNRGALWLVVLAMALPFFSAWLQRWAVAAEGAKVWQPAAGIAVALTLTIPVVPVLWAPAAVAVAAVAIRRRAGRWSYLRAGLAVTAPVVLWGPWLISILETPGRLLTGPSPLLGDTTTTAAWELLIGRAGASGLPPLGVSAAFFGCLWLAAVVAVIRQPKLALQGVAALFFLTLGVFFSRFTVAIDTSRVMPEATPWLLIAFALLLGMVAAWLDEGSQLVRQDFGVAQALIGAVSLIVVVCTAVGLVWWTAAGLSQVGRSDDLDIPYYLRVNEVEYGASSLLIDQEGDSVGWALRSGGRPTWAEGEMRTGALASPEAWQAAQRMVAQIAAGRYDEEMTASLKRMGVRYILVRGASADTAGALEAATGLGRAVPSDNGAALVWELADQPTRTQIVGEEGGAVSLRPGETIAEIGPGSRLVLSQPPDPAVVVTVGGAVLETVDSVDWRATYALGQATGEVAVAKPMSDRPWRVVQFALGFIMILFALPSAHARGGSKRSPRRADTQVAS